MSAQSPCLKIRLRLRHLSWLKNLYRRLRRVATGLNINGQRALALLRYRCPKCIGPSAGYFSAFQALENGLLEGEIVAKSQPVPAKTPDNLRKLCKLGQNGFQPWPIFWSHHRQARLVGPGLLLLDEKKRACLEAAFGQRHGDPSSRFVFHPPETHLEGNWTSLASRWNGGLSYYHWLLDGLTRLALLERFPPDTRILIPPRLLPAARESLEILGLEARVRPTPERNLILENYYFSAPSAMTGCANPFGIAYLRRKLLPAAAPARNFPERFFITRRSKTRGLLNEAETSRFFQAQGWAVLDMEKLTLREQIALFSHAKAVCGLHGAGFTNLAWCQPGCKVLEIFASTYLNGCYEGLAETIGCEHHFLIFNGNALDEIQIELPKVAKVIAGW